MIAVRWYLRYGLSYRDVEELLAERGIVVDHVTVYRWVQRFAPLLIDAARPCRHAAGDRWFVDEMYVRSPALGVSVSGDRPYRQVVDVLVTQKGDLAGIRRFFTGALEYGSDPTEATPDRAAAYRREIEELVQTSWNAPSDRGSTAENFVSRLYRPVGSAGRLLEPHRSITSIMTRSGDTEVQSPCPGT